MAQSLNLVRDHQINFLYCSECETPIGLTTRHEQQAREDSKVTFWCPRGHGQHFGKSEIDRARDKLAEQTRVATEMAARAAAAERAEQIAVTMMRTAEAETKRLQRWARAGVCPCCNRSFVALAKHMKTKHPEAGKPNSAPILEE